MRGYFNDTSSSNAIHSSNGSSSISSNKELLVNLINQLIIEMHQVLLGQKDQIEAKAEFDIAQFQKQFKQLEGETRVSLATSGVELGTGTCL
jgi:hypothetical protein